MLATSLQKTSRILIYVSDWLYSIQCIISAIPLLFDGSEVFSSASDEAKLFAKSSNLDDSVISFPAFLLSTNLKLHNNHKTPELSKKLLTNLNFSKVKDCIWP